MSYIIENGKSSQVSIESVMFERDNKNLTSTHDSDIRSLESKSFNSEGFAEAESCNTIEVSIVYDIDSGGATLQNQMATGEITGNIEIGSGGSGGSTSAEILPPPENVSLTFTG